MFLEQYSCIRLSYSCFLLVKRYLTRLPSLSRISCCKICFKLCCLLIMSTGVKFREVLALWAWNMGLTKQNAERFTWQTDLKIEKIFFTFFKFCHSAVLFVVVVVDITFAERNVTDLFSWQYKVSLYWYHILPTAPILWWKLCVVT